ncbi:AfsR/SARP family transcriptional regulator [Streptomyces sp. TBY4]|uniref:AfsR/SARP family transcriptional regulator n=1 Tax=Streptomyces sp. TBY4 TaxID=2962030 RepID=UPI0020B755BE|nr:AfsR/SARP family transcriptional regulator [Streptomyces sp. TBY4]MCP3759049.1 AfsR/SARP family transcriptional regulator [Streptomyces sp. TBY4]
MPTAGKPRQLLAILALRCGRVVQVPTLMEEVWGEDIPRSGMTTLQTYVLHLRRLITDALPEGAERAPKELLATRFNGYQLTVRPKPFDLVEFELLAGSGDNALERGDAAAASNYLHQALELWRGPALMDVPVGRVLSMELTGLNEVRMRVLEQRILADLWLGKSGTLIPELSKLVEQHPLHEKLAACLMIAYQRSGSGWRALEVFRGLRKALNRELGVEPSGRLQSLHRELLSNATELSLRDYVLT